jgi:site-specific DNA-methyltransferase (adenine-specific)
MKPYYEDEFATIYHGDCRDVLPTRCQLVLTDPPYGIAYETAWRSRGDGLRVPVAHDKDLSVVAGAWPLVMESLDEDTHWYAFASPRRMVEAATVFAGYKQVLAWDKGDRGTVGDLTCGFGEAWEAIYYGMKGRRPLRGPRPRTVVRKDWSGTMDPLHPTVKPVDLLQIMVGWSTDEGETVLDPFMGSGTTLVAAKNLGRKSIGIEIEERYCEIAAERLSQGVLAL